MAKNTITLNGISSETISGLIVQELPPITKPAQRTETELIDGRDGDIVTPLGYSAYDKEFTIGLYGNFDINAVIAFFNSEGTVVFSNEPDKYYNYQIVAEIDFERLVRFRTAKVKIHCQPFKYSATEGGYILDPPADSEIVNSGNTTSKPKLTVYGSGDVTVSLNGIQLFQIALGNTGYITIDTAAMEAYKDSTGNLQNRLVTGDYDNFALNPGANTITFTGTVTRCVVENYSRWI